MNLARHSFLLLIPHPQRPLYHRSTKDPLNCHYRAIIDPMTMKISRNDACPCHSGKKYKHCCMTQASDSSVLSEIEQITAMNPDLCLDELNVVMQHKIQARNQRPLDDFCGLSSTQMSNWLYASPEQLDDVTLTIPCDLSSSPVMQYLALIVEEAMQNDGSFKATAKGNLPTKLVKHASALLPLFAVAQFNTPISINEYAGANEDAFNALHYTRVLAEIAGIIYLRSGRWHVKKAAQKQYQSGGLHALFKPMLDAAVTQYNWGYLDAWEQEPDLRLFWLYMLWRLQHHGSVEQLVEEMMQAFPDLLLELDADHSLPLSEQLSHLLEVRFIERFLQYWGFVTLDPKRFIASERIPRVVKVQPLLTQVFEFHIE